MRLLNVAQVIDKLNISRGKVYNMIKNGTLPSVNIDGCIRVPEELLDDIISRQLFIEGKNETKVEIIHVLSGGGREGGNS